MKYELKNCESETIRYLRSFLLGVVDMPYTQWDKLLGYTDDPKLFSSYRIVIHPSGFFDKETFATIASMPFLPLQEFHGMPVLFGEPREEILGNTLIIYADLIASAYFLISRYEEILRRDVRDEHGRFSGKQSLPYRAGFIDRPILDEYSFYLKSCLPPGVVSTRQGIHFVHLSHDIDAPFLYRSWKGMIRSIRDGRGFIASVKCKFGKPDNDPYYTFPKLIESDDSLAEHTAAFSVSAYFRAGGGRSSFDKPRYSLTGKEVTTLMKLFRNAGKTTGLHVSYDAGLHPKHVRREKRRLEKACGHTITASRNHFLAAREPEDLEVLERAGILVDASMGYADTAGFRLGTSRTVRRINPKTGELGTLQLEPLIIMDCTLEEEKYMGLSHAQALEYCLRLFKNISRVGGDVSLLWHNTSFMSNASGYLPELYSELLKALPEYLGNKA
jgi:hypothetical protein